MENNRIIAAIDVGTSKVCTIVADTSDGIISRILGVNIVPSQGIQKAIVTNMGKAVDAIRESVAGVEHSSGLRVKSAYVGISGQHIKAFNNRATIDITRRDHLVTDKLVKRVFEASKSVDLPSDRKLIHAIPRYYILDGQSRIENPVGMYGYQLNVETHLITAGLNFILNLIKCVQQAGVEIQDLVSEAVADSESILEQEEREAGVLLADIGAGTTDITVYKQRNISYTSALPVAGYQVTRDISIGLGVPFSTAEKLKMGYGSVKPRERNRDEVIPLGRRGNVSYGELHDIITARVEEMFKLVLIELSRAELTEREVANSVLCGGSAKLAGIDALAQEVIGVPTRVARPKGMAKFADLDDPAFATGVGLLLWGAKQREEKVPTLQRLLQRFLFQLRRLWRSRRGGEGPMGLG
jgi:cell division protein FtsA